MTALTHDSLLTILSQPELALNAARAAGVEATDTQQLLRGCFVRCKAAYYKRGVPYYTPKRIVGVDQEQRSSDVGVWWKLRLGAVAGDSAADEVSTTVAYISNNSEGFERHCVGVGPGWTQFLAALTSIPPLWSTSAEREWHVLLKRENLVEDEPVDDNTATVVPGVYSHHQRLFSLLRQHVATLLGVLSGMSDDAYHRMLVSVPRLFEKWPGKRQVVAGEWTLWLLSLEQRRLGFPALREFVEVGDALAAEEHRGCDDAGEFSLHATSSSLFSIVWRKVAQPAGLPALQLEDSACPICKCATPRGLNDSLAWVRLHPCRHWLCSSCHDIAMSYAAAPNAADATAPRRRAAATSGDEEDETPSWYCDQCPLCKSQVADARVFGGCGKRRSVEKRPLEGQSS